MNEFIILSKTDYDREKMMNKFIKMMDSINALNTIERRYHRVIVEYYKFRFITIKTMNQQLSQKNIIDDNIFMELVLSFINIMKGKI